MSSPKTTKLQMIKLLKSRFTPVVVDIISDYITCPECSTVFTFNQAHSSARTFKNACCPYCGKALELNYKGGE